MMDLQAAHLEYKQRVANLELSICRIRTRLQSITPRTEQQNELFYTLSSSITFNFISMLNDRNQCTCGECYMKKAIIFLKLYSPLIEQANAMNLE